MQQSPTVMPVMPSFPPTNITTEQIQKYLDENKKLILAILDNQNLGKLTECAQYQALLQKNLMYLAAIADAQPQVPSPMAAAAAPHPAMQQGGYYMHPQSAAMAQQPPGFSPKMQMQFVSPHQLHQQQQQYQHQQQQQYQHQQQQQYQHQQQQQYQHQQQHQQQQQQQAMQGQLNMRPGGPATGMHSMQSEAALGGGGSGGQNRQSPSETGHSSDVAGSSAGGNGGGDAKGTEEGK